MKMQMIYTKVATPATSATQATKAQPQLHQPHHNITSPYNRITVSSELKPSIMIAYMHACMHAFKDLTAQPKPHRAKDRQRQRQLQIQRLRLKCL